MTTFETGASSAQSNNLVLSVMNDGAVYADRLHCGYAMLQGASHRLTFTDLARNEAIKQRAQGCKFNAAAISEAAKLIKDQTLTHCLETIREEWTGEDIQCEGRKWWDKVNGNTYFSARIVVPTSSGARWVSVPFQYGYGDQWQWECVYQLRRMGFDIPENKPFSELPIVFSGGEYTLKRNMFSGVYIKGI